MSNEELTIWSGAPPKADLGSTILLWDSYSDTHLSLPQIVHAQPQRWKETYVAWLKSIGTQYVGMPSAVRFAHLHGGLQYWWLTLPTDYSLRADCLAYSVMRTLAAIELINELDPRRVSAVDLPEGACEVLRRWCEGRGIEFQSEFPPNSSLKFPFKENLRGLVASALYIFSQHRTYGRKAARGSLNGDLVMIDYLASIGAGSSFTSGYWGQLVDLVPGATWLHVDVGTKSAPTVLSARELLSNLNAASSGRHYLAQDLIPKRRILKTLATYLAVRRLGRQGWRKVSFLHDASGVDLRPLVTEFWRRFHFSPAAADAAFWIHVFAYARIGAPCVYLMENQPWELAMLHFRLPSSTAVGFVHSFAREWDLRIMLPSLSLSETIGITPPIPNLIATGSSGERKLLIRNGYAGSQVVEVEAVRFLGSQRRHYRPRAHDDKLKVLALGEYENASTCTLLEAIRAVTDCVVRFRPHPTSQLMPHDLPPHVHTSVASSLAQDLDWCDLAVVMNTSSAALNADLAGVPIVVLCDGRSFEGTPANLRSVLARVSCNDQIPMSLLQKAWAAEPPRYTHDKLVSCDTKLPRWQFLLSRLCNFSET